METPPISKRFDYAKVKSKIRLEVAREFKEDEDVRLQIEREKAECEAAGIDYERYLKKKRPPLQRLRSFTECQLKFDDALEARQK